MLDSFVGILSFFSPFIQGGDSADEATGLTPNWSREASGDEEDDTSLMEFLPEGVTRMPSINQRRR